MRLIYHIKLCSNFVELVTNILTRIYSLLVNWHQHI